MAENNLSVKILTSLIGYGVYFPAEIVFKQLSQLGIKCDIYIIENLFKPEKKEIFFASRAAYSKNYRLAQMASKFPLNYFSNLDQDCVKNLLNEWNSDTDIHFLCFSGLWFDILNEYIPRANVKSIKCCKMDAGESYTWANNHDIKINHFYIFFDSKVNKINYTFNIPALKNSSFNDRSNSVVVHGGGWGLGNFIEKTESLGNTWHKKIIVKNVSDFNADKLNTVFYLNDPTWDPIGNDDNTDDFPALGEIINRDEINYKLCSEYHPVLSLLSDSKAVISKPGGMTFVDSILTETPLVYLEPMGQNESGNKKLIDTLDIGMAYDLWQQSDFNVQLLNAKQKNLKEIKKNIPDFVKTYLADLV